MITVDGRTCRPLSLGARLPRVRGDDSPQTSDITTGHAHPTRGRGSGRLYADQAERRRRMDKRRNAVEQVGDGEVVADG